MMISWHGKFCITGTLWGNPLVIKHSHQKVTECGFFFTNNLNILLKQVQQWWFETPWCLYILISFRPFPTWPLFPNWPMGRSLRSMEWCLITETGWTRTQPTSVKTCRQTSSIRRTKYKNLNISRLDLQLSLPNPLKLAEWRCSWSSADTRCSNYIWVISKFIAYEGEAYIRGLTVIIMIVFCFRKPLSYMCFHTSYVWHISCFGMFYHGAIHMYISLRTDDTDNTFINNCFWINTQLKINVLTRKWNERCHLQMAVNKRTVVGIHRLTFCDLDCFLAKWKRCCHSYCWHDTGCVDSHNRKTRICSFSIICILLVDLLYSGCSTMV